MTAVAPLETAAAPVPVLVATGVAPAPERPLHRRRLVLRVFALALAVAGVVTAAGGLVARHLAESEAVRDVTVRTDDIALDVVQPVLTDGIATGDPSAIRLLDARVRESLTGRDIARVKVWSSTGTIVYSDEPRLRGARFGLDDEERETLETGGTEAEVSDLDEPENRFERNDGRLLEVYRPIATPDGTRLLFEVYYRYDDVLASSQNIWSGFAAVTALSVLLLLIALLPLLNGLVRTVERAREERERSLLRALGASDAERRRIAGAVHDGPVQDLIGAAYRLGAVSADVRGTELEPAVASAEEAVHGSVEGLRDMLVDLYPAALSEAGLGTALGDMVAGARSRGSVVLLRVADDVVLSEEAQRLVFRIARETIANGLKHGGGTAVAVDLRTDGRGAVLTVRDGGAGFDAAAVLRKPPAGHFGMRLLQDAVAEGGVDAVLRVESAAGAGTCWRLEVR